MHASRRVPNSPTVQFPLKPTKFCFVCDNCRRCPSCGPYTVRTEVIPFVHHTSGLTKLTGVDLGGRRLSARTVTTHMRREITHVVCSGA